MDFKHYRDFFFGITLYTLISVLLGNTTITLGTVLVNFVLFLLTLVMLMIMKIKRAVN